MESKRDMAVTLRKPVWRGMVQGKRLMAWALSVIGTGPFERQGVSRFFTAMGTGRVALIIPGKISLRKDCGILKQKRRVTLTDERLFCF